MKGEPSIELTPSLKFAVESILLGEAVLFLGAGSSKYACNSDGNTLPLGQELADLLALECGLGEGYGLGDISEHFIEQRSEVALLNTLKKYLTVVSVDEALRKLVQLPWIRIWTTNYDNSIELACDSSSTTYYHLTTLDSLGNAKGNKNIAFYINGNLRNKDVSLGEDLILTSRDYATNHFLSNPWSTTFRHDILRSKAVIFAGYSLADLDIARTIFNPDAIKQKVHFIEWSGLDPVARTKLSKFGSVHSIGLEVFVSGIERITDSWEKPELKETYQSFDKIRQSESLSHASDDDFYNLILNGELQDNLLSDQIQKNTYVVERDHEKDCIKHLTSERAVSILVGSFANGKTVSARRIGLKLTEMGRDVFILEEQTDLSLTEMIKLCRRDTAFTLILENCRRNIELVQAFCQYANNSCSLLLTERSEKYELGERELEVTTETWNLKTWDLDTLIKDEIGDFVELIDYRGKWGDKKGSSLASKKNYVLEQCGGRLSGLLLDLIRSPDIRQRLDVLVQDFSKTHVGRKVLVTLCLLQSIGEHPRVDVLQDLLDVDYNSFKELTKQSSVKALFRVNSNKINFNSPVVARAILLDMRNATLVTDVIEECIKRSEIFKSGDSYIKKLGKEFIRFGNIERILPEKEKRIALQNLYENIKSLPSFRNNPLFWLQYAIARISLGDLSVAKGYLDQARSIAEKMDGFDTYQIDNHYCRLLFMQATNEEDADQAYTMCYEALNILKGQVLRESRHYPYRASWELEGVVRRYSSSWTQDQNTSIKASSQNLLDAAGRLKPAIARHESVKGAVTRLKGVIELLK